MRGLLHRYEGRIRALRTTEALLGAIIIAVWSVAATGLIAPPVVTLIVVGVSLLLHFVAVDSGSFVVLWIMTGWLLALIVISSQSVLEGAHPLVFTIAGVSALAHNELIRAGYNRRRNASVDDEVFVSSAVGVGLAGLIAVIAIGITTPLATSGGGRSWLWMPVAAGVITLAVLALTVLPTIRAPHPNKERWQPGDRLARDPSTDESPIEQQLGR